MKGVIYTETLIYAAPQAFVSEAPYQLVIVTLEDGTRVTGRVDGDRVRIDDAVDLVGHRNGVPLFRKQGSPPAVQQAPPEEKVLPQETL